MSRDSRKNRWALRPSDLPPLRARREFPELAMLEENPIFRAMNRLQSVRGATFFTPERTLDLWLAGIRPETIFAGVWGHYSAASYRRGWAMLGIAIIAIGLFTEATVLLAEDAASAVELSAVFYIMGAALLAFSPWHPWFALLDAESLLENACARWHLAPRQVRLWGRTFTKALLAMPLFCAILLGSTLGSIWILEAALAKSGSQLFWLMRALLALAHALIGAAIGAGIGIALRARSNGARERCVVLIEEMFKVWRIAAETDSKAAGAPGE